MAGGRPGHGGRARIRGQGGAGVQHNLSHWVHDIDPMLFHIYGDFGVRYYGLAYILAFVGGYLFLRLAWREGRSPLDPEKIDNVFLAIAGGVIIGGRLGHVLFYELGRFLGDPLMVFRLWDGGMSSHGGFIGVALALIWAARRYGLSFAELGDLICPIAPLGLMMGRVANFINGELWGTPSQAPWAVIFPRSAPPGVALEQVAARHPSQLYEAALEGLLLLLIFQWRFWFTKANKFHGRLSGEFLILYATVRIFCEQFREPDAGLILGMSRGSFYSLFLLAWGAVLWFRSGRRAEKPGHAARKRKNRV